MNLRKSISYGVPVVLATMVAATSAQAFLYNDVFELRERTITGDTFQANLAREYQVLARYESEEMYDWGDAERHANKGNLAATGKTPMPNEPAKWHIESKANLDELQSARAQLVGQLDAGARTVAPSLAATAQAKYDCWVEQQEEGHQPTHIAACKDQFWLAMAGVNTAMAPKLTTTKTFTTTVSREVAREEVFFGFDQATITPAESAKLDRFVNRMRGIEGVALRIVGHADTSGPANYNQILSASRAKAVTNNLISQGMKVRNLDGISVAAEGETTPKVATGDGVRAAQNRRVEIVAVGDVEVTQKMSSTTTR